MLDLDTELGALVKEELRRGWYAQAVNARARQMRIAQANAVLEHAHIEGVGQHVASIDAFAFYDWERRNPGITRDKDWLKSLLRDNPECRVESKSSKTQVSFAGMDFNPSEPTGICPSGLDQEPKRLTDEETSEISNLQSEISPAANCQLPTANSEEAA
jgi:hypothetical protein